jgi:hypothetical protein
VQRGEEPLRRLALRLERAVGEEPRAVTLSRLMSLLALSGALAGSDSSSTVKYSTSRPPSLPPFSSTASLKPFVMALPSAAYVPV